MKMKRVWNERGSEKHVCGRRNEGGVASRFPGPDRYRRNGGMVNSFAPGCTFCGSISGAEFLRYVREGNLVGGSDKSYKVYLEKDSGKPSITIKKTKKVPGGGKYEIHEPKPGTGIMHAKFYFQHLSDTQRAEFVSLWNLGKVKHRLYVRPYFMGLRAQEPNENIGDPITKTVAFLPEEGKDFMTMRLHYREEWYREQEEKMRAKGLLG
jgi:hypothetical protein